MWQAVSPFQTESCAGTARIVLFPEHREVLASPTSRVLPPVTRSQLWRHIPSADYARPTVSLFTRETAEPLRFSPAEPVD